MSCYIKVYHMDVLSASRGDDIKTGNSMTMSMK